MRVENLLASFPNNKVLVDSLTGQILLEQDGYSVVFASEGPPLLGCKGRGKNHPKTVDEARVRGAQEAHNLPLFLGMHLNSHIAIRSFCSFHNLSVPFFHFIDCIAFRFFANYSHCITSLKHHFQPSFPFRNKKAKPTRITTF
jgi:hypothetical protein